MYCEFPVHPCKSFIALISHWCDVIHLTCVYDCAVFSLDTLGEEDTESMLNMEVVEEPEPTPGPQGQDIGAPTAPPKKSPPNFNHGLKKKKRHGNKSPLSDKPQDLQVWI